MTPAPEKRRPRSAAAFTLAELLVVIAVIVILVGVGIAAFSGVVKKARTSVCLHERRTVKTAYLLEADEEEYNVPKSKRGELLGRAIKSLGGTVIDSGSYKATCGGTCTVTYSDDNCRILDISCSIHGGTTLEKDKFAPGDSTGLERAEKGLSAVFGSTDTFAVIKNYFADKKNFSSLNSLGHNFAPAMNIALAKLGYSEFGYGLPEYGTIDYANVDYSKLESAWRVYYNPLDNPDQYELYWTDTNISSLAVGTRVRYVHFIYNLNNGELLSKSTGMVPIKYETLNEKINGVMTTYTVPYLEASRKTPDADYYGSSWGEPPPANP